MRRFEKYFDKIFVINRLSRTDRWKDCMAEFKKFDLLKPEFFHAYDECVFNGYTGGNGGCTTSHRALLDVIGHHKWNRVLILEDDFKIIYDDFHDRFESMIDQVPSDWEMLYLGGHYGAVPQGRVSPNVIRAGPMLTTSSYAVTWQAARKIAPYIYGADPIDSLYHKWNMELKCYVLSPRLIVQRAGFSDLQGRWMDNEPCMVDTSHETQV